MSSESVSSVIVELLDNNRKVARAVVGLYRQGGTKLLDKSLPGTLGNRGQRVKDLLQSVIGRAADTADIALDTVYARTAKAVVKVATTVDGFAGQYAPRSVQLARQIALPAARIARRVSARVASTAGNVYPIKAQKNAAKPIRKATRQTRKKK